MYLRIAFLSAASNKIFSWWASWPQNMSHFLTSKLNDTYAFYRPVLRAILPRNTVMDAFGSVNVDGGGGPCSSVATGG